MRTLLALLLSVFITSCGCEYHMKRAAAKCGPLKQTESVYEKTIEVTRIRDTTLYLTVPGPVQYLPNPCEMLCDSAGHLRPFVSIAHKNGITSKVYTKGNVLIAECETDSLKARISYLERQLSSYVKVKKEIDRPVMVRSWWTQFTSWYFWITAAFIAGRFALKRFKPQ